MIRWVAGVLALLAVGGGAYYYFHDDPLRAELDRRWPPVTADQQRQAATDAAATALKALTAPNNPAKYDACRSPASCRTVDTRARARSD